MNVGPYQMRSAHAPTLLLISMTARKEKQETEI